MISSRLHVNMSVYVLVDIYLRFERLDGSKPFNSLDCLSEVVLIRLAVGKFFLISVLHLDGHYSW